MPCRLLLGFIIISVIHSEVSSFAIVRATAEPTLHARPTFRLKAKSEYSRASSPSAPPPQPFFSFASSFSFTALPAPLLALGASEYFHEPLAFIVPVVGVLFLVSIPYALVTGTVAAIASLTTRNPSFFDNLTRLYSKIVPEGVSNTGSSAVSLFVSGLERVGLAGVLGEEGGAKGVLFDVALAVLSPFLPAFLRSVEDLAARVEDGEDVGDAVCKSVVDGAERVMDEAVTIGGGVYGFVVLCVVGLALGIDTVF